MGAIGKGKSPLATQIPVDHAAFVKARTDRLDWTLSKAAARIVEMWIEAGAPALSEADAAMPPLTFEQFKKERGSYGVAVKPHPAIHSPRGKKEEKKTA